MRLKSRKRTIRKLTEENVAKQLRGACRRSSNGRVIVGCMVKPGECIPAGVARFREEDGLSIGFEAGPIVANGGFVTDKGLIRLAAIMAPISLIYQAWSAGEDNG